MRAKKSKLAADLVKLAKKDPKAFIEAYALLAAAADAAEQNYEIPQEDMKVSAKEVLEDYADNTFLYFAAQAQDKIIEGISIKTVAAEGGSAGEGEVVVRVWQVLKNCTSSYGVIEGEHVVYIRGYGYYDSYNGTELNEEAEVVAPYEVLTIQYHTPTSRKQAVKSGVRFFDVKITK